MTALVAMLIIAALVSATAMRVDEERRASRAITLQHVALASAEGAVWRTFVSADAQMLRAAPIGLSSQATSTVDGLTQKVTVTKIDTAMVWIVGSTQIQHGREVAAHRVALWALLPSDTISTRLTPLPGGAWADLY